MIKIICRYVLIVCLAVAAWAWNGEIRPNLNGGLIATADAVVGRPATPVRYAGVARRSTVGIGAPGVGVMPGVGVGAPGVGAAPMNRGGPVNRVGRR